MSSAASWRSQFKATARSSVQGWWKLHELSAQGASQKAMELCTESCFIYQDGESRKPYRHASLFEVMNTFIVHRSTGLTQPYGMLFEQYLDEIMRKPPFVAFALTAIQAALHEYAASPQGYKPQRFDTITYGGHYKNHLASILRYKDRRGKAWQRVGDDLVEQASNPVGATINTIAIQPIIEWDSDNDDSDDETEGEGIGQRYLCADEVFE